MTGLVHKSNGNSKAVPGQLATSLREKPLRPHVKTPAKPISRTPFYCVPKRSGVGPPKNSILYRIRDWPQRIHDAGYSVATVAAASGCGCSVRTLQRFFRHEMGNGPARCIRCVRMKLAMEMLRSGSNVNETADQLSYPYSAHFSTDFKKFYTVSPGDHETICTNNSENGEPCRVFVENCRVTVEKQDSQTANYMVGSHHSSAVAGSRDQDTILEH
jgi:AraC-like DNA-binding protein